MLAAREIHSNEMLGVYVACVCVCQRESSPPTVPRARINRHRSTGKPDSYVVVAYGGQEFRTKVVNDSEEPAYNEDIVS